MHLDIIKYILFRSLQLLDYLDNFQNNYQEFQFEHCSQHGFYFSFFKLMIEYMNFYYLVNGKMISESYEY